MRIIQICGILLFSMAGMWANDVPDHVPGQLIVRLKENADPGVLTKLVAAHGARLKQDLPQTSMSVVDVPEAALDALRQRLERSGAFEFVERDHWAREAAVPNDPQFVSQWHLTRIQAALAWDVSKGPAGALIAVVDSGIDAGHPDLKGKVVSGWSFVKGSSDTSDVSGHGTAVSGAVAAVTNNLTGVAGVAWNTAILPVAVLDSSGYASYSNIAAGIQYAADRGARIINVSLGGTSSSSALQAAVDYAWNKGAVVFAAAMNESTSSPRYPAACARALGISATDANDTLASFSNYGSWISLSAPGYNILTTSKGGGYGYWWGTSLATPVAAGVGALALGAKPSLTASDLALLLKKNSDDLGPAGFDSSFGWGRVNAYRAVKAAAGTSSTGTTTTTTSSGTFSPIRVNAGGAAYTDPQGRVWKADTGYSGGSMWSTTDSVANTTAPKLYQSCRYGGFSYQFAVPDGTYKVTLKFAEVSQTAAGLRQFNVAINGTRVLTNFDIFAAAGGMLRAIDKSFTATASGGKIAIQFSYGAAKWPLVNAIEIVEGSGSGTTAASPIRVNSAGAAYTDPQGRSWKADTGYSGGSEWSTTASVANTTTPKLYQSCRYGGFSYQLAVPDGTYKVILKFAEPSQNGAGLRQFNVAINGTRVLTNFDIFAAAGGMLRAIDKSFTVSASGGKVSIQFSYGAAKWPLVNAIDIEPQ